MIHALCSSATLFDLRTLELHDSICVSRMISSKHACRTGWSLRCATYHSSSLLTVNSFKCLQLIFLPLLHWLLSYLEFENLTVFLMRTVCSKKLFLIWLVLRWVQLRWGRWRLLVLSQNILMLKYADIIILQLFDQCLLGYWLTSSYISCVERCLIV